MSSGSSLRSEDQFLCSICLDVFTDPVSTPCGHNFCKTCITQHWDGNGPYKCPLCNELFTPKPELRVNTFIKEMVDQFRLKAQQESFSSGRFYFEVQVKGKTDWALGVARESVDRKGTISLRPQNGFWTFWLRNGYEYKAGAGPSVRLHLHPGPQKVGVFVDYDEGLVSFYDVDAVDVIYSFTGCGFTQKLYPFLSPSLNDGGKNSSALIICPVN
ncbi:nuclear factor 7, ovary-like [Poecilia latipinna]|uniref:nuclear factor 7, ovary-like n=1 Tax=Poecilia latipinna TaxID=48699 RepID=UPI00072E7277|nr:PREDICTED: nuclear factor 7, ovary-like [Poecilia latipinna]